MTNRKERVEQIVIWTLASISILVSVLDFIGVFESVPWIGKKTPAFTLLTLGIIAGYLVLERRNKLDTLETLVSEGRDLTIKSLGGALVKSFTKDEEVTKHIIESMHNAKESILDLTWLKQTRFYI